LPRRSRSPAAPMRRLEPAPPAVAHDLAPCSCHSRPDPRRRETNRPSRRLPQSANLSGRLHTRPLPLPGGLLIPQVANG
jgi:hypothetical protein